MKIIMDLNHILEDAEHNDDNDIYIIMKKNHHYNDLRMQHIQINKLLFSISDIIKSTIPLITAPITQYTTSFASFTPSKSPHEAIHMDTLDMDIDIELPIKNGKYVFK
eukprot:290483_1